MTKSFFRLIFSCVFFCSLLVSQTATAQLGVMTPYSQTVYPSVSPLGGRLVFPVTATITATSGYIWPFEVNGCNIEGCNFGGCGTGCTFTLKEVDVGVVDITATLDALGTYNFNMSSTLGGPPINYGVVTVARPTVGR